MGSHTLQETAVETTGLNELPQGFSLFPKTNASNLIITAVVAIPVRGIG